MAISREDYEAHRSRAEVATGLKEATFTGTLMGVENPARREDGTALSMAKVTIRGDVGDPKKPDRP